MEVDDFMIQRLNNLKLRVLGGQVTDWPNSHYRHISHMTCRLFLLASPTSQRNYKWQLAQICQQFRIAPE